MSTSRTANKDLLVIGGASLDTLHFSGQTAYAAGGAGMYTAAAAQRDGATVSMFAPRPSPVPAPLQPILSRVEWIGPTITPAQLPHFEIAHHGGGKATLLDALWGAESCLTPHDLPDDLSGYRLVHIAALRSALSQLEFLVACRQRGATRISIGTYARVVELESENVQTLIQQADLFFMNENEADGLFGSVENTYAYPGRLLFVTMGDQGARVVQGGYATIVSAPEADEVDPTGAGDTFCGTTLAGLARGDHPIMAARKAAAEAAKMISFIGPRGLWSEARSGECYDFRVKPNEKQISRVAELVGGLPEVHPFDFIGPGFPPIHHPSALDFFFAATLQQFGFWYTQDGHYVRPLMAPIAASIRKGSDYLWHAYLQRLEEDCTCCAPLCQADLTHEEMTVMFRSEDGRDPVPAIDLHLTQARSYGLDMQALSLSPADIVSRANKSSTPLGTFIQSMDHIGGYKEDPLRKKSSLLALILSERPEKFLRTVPGEQLPPIIDYHLMRSCLRVGLVDVLDPVLRRALIERRLLHNTDEWVVRRASYDAISQLTALSGKSMAAVDRFFFNARHRCPEMTDPQCSKCEMDPVCAHLKDLFQPVLRTVFY